MKINVIMCKKSPLLQKLNKGNKIKCMIIKMIKENSLKININNNFKINNNINNNIHNNNNINIKMIIHFKMII